jgi:hypothetical protein
MSQTVALDLVAESGRIIVGQIELIGGRCKMTF